MSGWSGSKLFDTLIIFLKEFLKKVDFEKKQQRRKKHAKLPSMQRIKMPYLYNTRIIEHHSVVGAVSLYRKMSPAHGSTKDWSLSPETPLGTIGCNLFRRSMIGVSLDRTAVVTWTNWKCVSPAVKQITFPKL